jgi:hypothetical protein
MGLSYSWASILGLILLCLSFGLVSETNGQCVAPTGYAFSKSLLGDAFQFHWTINYTDYSVKIAYEARTSGWIGIGVSKETPPAMVGSEAVIGLVSGSSSIHPFRLNEKDSSSFTPIDNSVPLRNTTICEYTKDGNIWTLGIFTRSLSSGSNPISLTSDVPMVIAYGSTDALIEHPSDAKTTFSLNFVTGELVETQQEAKTKQSLQIAHGALMVAAFGVLLPSGVVIARYTKTLFGDSWFVVHMVVQLAGYFIGFAAFVIGLYMVDRSHFDTKAHAQLGLAVIVAGVIQVALGFFRPDHVEKGLPKPIYRFVWEIAHKSLGKIINVVSIVTIFFGLYEISAHIGFYIGYAVFVGLLILTIVGIEIAKCVMKRKKKRAPLATHGHEEL